MKVNWDGDVYELDLDEIDVSQACTIKREWHLTLLGLDNGLNEADPEALLAIYWLMHQQTEGKTLGIRDINFKVVKFASAVQDAAEAAAKEAEDKAKAEGKPVIKAAAKQERPT